MRDILPEFQKFIAQHKLGPANQIPFYTYWVSKFLRFSNAQQDKSLDLRIQMFFDVLKKDKKLLDWQLIQADKAIKLQALRCRR
jgi:hypothetical protein